MDYELELARQKSIKTYVEHVEELAYQRGLQDGINRALAIVSRIYAPAEPIAGIRGEKNGL